jgi:predicted transport protein
MRELAGAVDEVLLGLGDGVNRVERKTYRAYQRLRNFACARRSAPSRWST